MERGKVRRGECERLAAAFFKFLSVSGAKKCQGQSRSYTGTNQWIGRLPKAVYNEIQFQIMHEIQKKSMKHFMNIKLHMKVKVSAHRQFCFGSE